MTSPSGYRRQGLTDQLGDAGDGGRVAHWIDARPESGRRNP
jgi:hypothetical protein